MTNKANLNSSIFIPIICSLAIIMSGVWFLIMQNSDVLFMAQNLSFFSNDPAFYGDCMQVPGGLLNWLGSYFTQYFYDPQMGGSIFSAMLVLLFWVIKKAWNISNEMSVIILLIIAALLSSVIDLGYWIYYIKMPGYYFREVLGFIVVSLFILALNICVSAINRKNSENKNVWICASYTVLACIALIAYPLIGWYSTLAVGAIFTHAIAHNLSAVKGGKITGNTPIQKFYKFICGLLFGLALSYNITVQSSYTAVNTAYRAFANFPLFDSDSLRNWTLSAPFIVAAVLLLILPFVSKIKFDTILAINPKARAVYSLVSFTIILACGAFLRGIDFDDYNYHAECRMYRAVDESKWNDVLSEMAKLPNDATREMVLFKNIALFNTGRAGTDMFRYNNKGKEPVTRDTLHIHMVQTAAPLIYLHHGKTNFSYRWCIENTVEFGYRIDYLKMLARASLINGEMEVAEKYLKILSGTKFYREWAEHLMPIISNPDKIREYPEFANIIELRDNMGSVLDGDNGLCEMYLLNYFSNTMNKDSKYLQEMTLVYSMIQKDIQLFWPRFFLYAQLHQGDAMPILYQEAAFLYGNLEPGNVDISKMPFDKEKVMARYASFNQTSQQLLQNGMNAEQVGAAMYNTFGDTFWWFYFFCRDVHSY